jgi:hypothetical protein
MQSGIHWLGKTVTRTAQRNLKPEQKSKAGVHLHTPHIKSSLKLAVSFLIPNQHLTGLDRFLTLKPAPLGLGSLTDTRPVRRLDLSSPEREQVQPAPARVLAHLGLKAENRCFQSRLDIRY